MFPIQKDLKQGDTATAFHLTPRTCH